ncbi:LysR substrate-binding domain-containing protein [Achromobacter aegrifaciens]|uniref:LysR substrate-binding domain-containing protein n=1 Tax=Achromobacter aegrifaciens TaxID=1287736 RepID=UPI00146907C7|nr:LysR substrate-binding domain-containing protein [Achromobacter aegrifaciens]CAB3849969.1 HTH-type transcriptional regulator GbpR [Achromobacter aegrifaciens]
MPDRAGTHLKRRHAELLVALDDERHLGRAAEGLHMSQPAASKALAQLEEQVGYALFERGTRGTLPTNAGMVMIRHARHSLGAAQRVAAELRAAEERGASLLRLGTLPSAAPHLAPQLIAHLLGLAPRLEVKLVEGALGELMDKLARDELDIVLGRLGSRLLPADCEVIRLHEEPILVVARPGHPLAASEALAAAELARWPWVLPLEATMMRERLDEAFVHAGAHAPVSSIQSNSLLATLALLAQDDRLAALPQAIARYCERQGSVTVLPLRLDANFGAIGAVVNRNTAGMPVVQAAMAWLRGLSAGANQTAPDPGA